MILRLMLSNRIEFNRIKSDRGLYFCKVGESNRIESDRGMYFCNLASVQHGFTVRSTAHLSR